jgi:hypothetical protein
MKKYFITTSVALALSLGSFADEKAAAPAAAADEKDFKVIFDGKSLDGWKKSEENQSAFSLENGTIKANGDRSHLFYTGDDKPYTNFVLRLQVMTKANSNGGVFVHTKYQEKGWPNNGHECQVNNTFNKDPRKSGSVYRCKDITEQLVQDDVWWDYEIKVVDKTCTISFNGKVVNEWTEPEGGAPGVDASWRFNGGTFALQAHDPGSTVFYKNIRVKRLP